MGRWARFVPALWSLALALLMLGPALRPGYVLSYDMVWVPDLALTPDTLGLGSGLPRAVPSDAIVAVIDNLVPGMLVQKAVLLGILMGAGSGAGVMLREKGLLPRLAAVTFYEWNAFVVERLVLGHWPLLIAYAALPWIAVACREHRSQGRVAPRLWILVPLASLSASAGLMSAFVLVALGVRRSQKRALTICTLVLTANAPWLIAGFLHAAVSYVDPRGAYAFAAADEGAVPAPLAALSGGAIWNHEVVPPSRTGALAWGWVALIALVVLVGARRWWRTVPRPESLGLLACGLVGWGVAVGGWAGPGLYAWVGAHVPGGGLFRDSSRFLGLVLLLLTQIVGAAATRLREGLPETARPAIGAVLVLGPVALMTDAAFGASGTLFATRYPADYANARLALEATKSESHQAEAVLLPFTAYRNPRWNRSHKVLDPTGRYLGVEYTASDTLSVSGRSIRGEDPRARRTAQALDARTPDARARALRGTGAELVVVELSAGTSPDVSGEVVHRGDQLAVMKLAPSAEPRPVPTNWLLFMSGAWLLFCASLAWGLVEMVRHRHARPVGSDICALLPFAEEGRGRTNR